MSTTEPKLESREDLLNAVKNDPEWGAQKIEEMTKNFLDAWLVLAVITDVWVVTEPEYSADPAKVVDIFNQKMLPVVVKIMDDLREPAFAEAYDAESENVKSLLENTYKDLFRSDTSEENN